MSLDARVKELLEEGERELAEELARGAAGSQAIQNIEVNSTGVAVETQSFVGRYTLSPSAETVLEHVQSSEKDKIVLADVEVGSGRYSFKSDIDLSIVLNKAHENEIEHHLREQYCRVERRDRAKNMSGIVSKAGMSNTTSESEDGDVDWVEQASQPQSRSSSGRLGGVVRTMRDMF